MHYQQSYEDFMMQIGLFKFIEKRTKQKNRPKNEKVHNVPIRKYKQQQLEEIDKLQSEIEKLKAEKKDLAGSVLDDEPKKNHSKNRMFEGDFLDL